MTEDIKCPKCKSSHIHSDKKGFSGKKAVAGAVLVGGVGVLAGTIGSNKIKLTCLNCGHVFNPGEQLKEHVSFQACDGVNTSKYVEQTKTYKCGNCGKVSTRGECEKSCPQCGYRLNDKDLHVADYKSTNNTKSILIVALIILTVIIIISLI
jgi:uncharacterized CHY-type Zn-finger protein